MSWSIETLLLSAGLVLVALRRGLWPRSLARFAAVAFGALMVALVAVLPVQAAGASPAAPSPAGPVRAIAAIAASRARPECRPDWSAGVYHTYRFKLLSACRMAAGVVVSERREADRDWHLDVRLAPRYKGLLSSGNDRYQGGNVVVEIIPMDQPHVRVPAVGQAITVWGAWVDDKDHGWNEIHPAWIVNGRGTIDFTNAAADASVTTGICGNGDRDCPKGGVQTGGSTGLTAKGLTVVASSLRVAPGQYASVEIRTTPGVLATIEVLYASGPSRAAGLAARKADGEGQVVWSWRVGTSTTPGSWPVVITAGGHTLKLALQVE